MSALTDRFWAVADAVVVAAAAGATEVVVVAAGAVVVASGEVVVAEAECCLLLVQAVNAKIPMTPTTTGRIFIASSLQTKAKPPFTISASPVVGSVGGPSRHCGRRVAGDGLLLKRPAPSGSHRSWRQWPETHPP